MTSVSDEPAPPTVTVLVADDDPQVRTALGDLIGRRRGLELVAAVDDGVAAGRVAAELRPDVAVVDVRMPAGGVDAVRAVRRTSPNTAVVVYTAFADPVLERQLLDAGATTFALKGDRRTDIIRTIEAAASSTPGT
jgi:DNA-binding NarL/FixJ family response regulator